jgi:hypothetical protein
MQFCGVRTDHHRGIEPAIDAHPAPEAAADLKGELGDGVAGEARSDRLEIRDFPGRTAAGQFRSPYSMPTNGQGLPAYCVPERCKSGKRL